MEQSESIAELAKALAEAQGALASVPLNKENPYFKSHYADLGALWEAARPELSSRGLSVTQTFEPYTGGVDGRLVNVTTTLTHVSGQWRSGTLSMPTGEKTTPQSVGSAITYARRYSLAAMLGLVGAPDDDAEGAEGRKGSAPKASTPDKSTDSMEDLL